MQLLVLHDILPPTELPPSAVPEGWIWEREPDEVDRVDPRIIWEGNWVLKKIEKIEWKPVEKRIEIKIPCNEKCVEIPCTYTPVTCYSNIEKQRACIAQNINPVYYACTHKSHQICTNSLCCDFFWHGEDYDTKECHYRGEDGDQEAGMAQIFCGTRKLLCCYCSFGMADGQSRMADGQSRMAIFTGYPGLGGLGDLPMDDESMPVI